METVAGGGSTAELLAPIEEIRAASEAFKDAFRDEASLERAMRAHVMTRMKFRIADDVALLDMVKAAAGSGKAGRKASAELATLLQDNWGSMPDAERWLEAGDREQIVANKGWKAWKKEKAKHDEAGERERAAFQKRRADAVAKGERLRKAGKSDADIEQLVRCRSSRPRSRRSRPRSASSPSEPPARSSRCGRSSAARSRAAGPAAARVGGPDRGHPLHGRRPRLHEHAEQARHGPRRQRRRRPRLARRRERPRRHALPSSSPATDRSLR